MGKKRDEDDIHVEDVPVFATCEKHGTTAYLGRVSGVIRQEPEGETVYEDRNSSSVGYSPRYTNKWEGIFGKKSAEEAN